VQRIGVAQTIRAREWWEHKLAPVMATGYATAWLLDVSLTDVWPALALTLLAIAVGASYVSLVNDLTDLEHDRAAGKANRLEGRSRGFAGAAIGICVGVGIAIGALAWADDPAAVVVYTAGWIAFSAYSIPPLRLKARGVYGAIADALAAGLVPQVLVVILVFHHADSAIDRWWVAIVASWALAHGLRAAIWHQVGDVFADTVTDVRTLARSDPRRTQLVTLRALFPLELASFGALLVYAGNWLAVGLIALYLLLVRDRAREPLRIRTTVMTPGENRQMAMHEYYVVMYPLAFLVAACVRHAADAIFLPVHVALFAQASGRTARSTRHSITRLRGLWVGR
jgi:UbiA prenyltransferase family protein